MPTMQLIDDTAIEPPEDITWGCELEAHGVSGYDEGDELPQEFRDLITQLVMVQADLETELVFDTTVIRAFVLNGPDPRSRMRMAKFFAEEIGHGYTFWKIAKTLGVELTPAYFRAVKRKRQEAFANVGLVDDWTELAIVNTLTDRMGTFLFNDMADCAYLPWARISESVAKDEAGHASLGYANLSDAVRRRGKRADAQHYLEKWYPMSLDMFGRSDTNRQWRYVAWGLKHTGNEKMRRMWANEVGPLLENLDLEVPDYMWNRKFL
ncbi:MAG TPA: Phenylacetic acid catabolic protein [Streptosporangiaceae bacterium]